MHRTHLLQAESDLQELRQAKNTEKLASMRVLEDVQERQISETLNGMWKLIDVCGCWRGCWRGCGSTATQRTGVSGL
jgi:hypothetical protein